MTTKLKILQGNSTEKFICDSDILDEYNHLFVKVITWEEIFKLLKWIEGKYDVKMEYTPGKKLIITKGN